MGRLYQQQPTSAISASVVAAVCTALPAGDAARGGHAGPRHRLSSDVGPFDSQSRFDARERSHKAVTLIQRFGSALILIMYKRFWRLVSTPTIKALMDALTVPP